MSGTRVELRVSFTVSSDLDQGREDAENAIRAIERLGAEFAGCYDFEVAKGSVNGNAWHERWPDKPTAPVCGKYSKWHRYGGTLGPCNKAPGHDGEWHLDGSGAAWDPAIDA